MVIFRPGSKGLTKKTKKGRPPSENPMVHTAVVLPKDLLERLRTNAEAAEHGLSTEIRERLYFAHSLQNDPVTSDLVRLIKNLADGVADARGKKWHEHPKALAAFKAGVAEYLAQYHPEGDASTPPGEHDDHPETEGRTLARLFRKASRKEG